MVIDWNTVIGGAILLVLGGLGTLGWRMLLALGDIKIELAELSTQVKANALAAKTWQDGHEKLNEAKFEDLSGQITQHDANDQRRFDDLNEHVSVVERRLDNSVAA